MAFGKADTGLIQADRAAREMDPMLGVSAGVGNFLAGLNKTYDANAAAMAKAASERGDKWDKITTDLMSANNKLPREQRRELKQLFRFYKKQYANAADSADMDEIYDNFEREANITNKLAADINVSRDNGQNYGPGFDDNDIYFSTAFTNGESQRVNRNGKQMIRIKNPEGYNGGADSDGFTYFPINDPPVGMDQWSDGSAAILGNWNEQVTNRKDFSNVMTAGEFADTYKAGFPKNMTYYQGQDLITADHSKDGKDNSFYNEFISGNLPPEFYQSLNTGEQGAYITVKRADGTEVAYDPNSGDKRGGLTEQELSDFIKGKNFNGVKNYGDMGDINKFIQEKYGDFMGIVTKDAYDLEQKKKLEANNKYFIAPSEDGSGYEQVVGDDGDFIDVTKKKQDTLKDFKFDSATSFNMMQKTGDGMEDVEQVQVQDWNKVTDWENQITEDGNFVKNLQSNYNYDDVTISADDGVLTIGVGEGNNVVNETFDFNSTRDKNLVLKEMKNHLSRSKFNDFSELTTLGNDASKWNETIKANNTSILQQLPKKQVELDQINNLDRTSKEWSDLVLKSDNIMKEEDLLQAYSTRLGKEFTTVEDYFKAYMEVDNAIFPNTASQFNKNWKARTGVDPNME